MCVGRGRLVFLWGRVVLVALIGLTFARQPSVVVVVWGAMVLIGLVIGHQTDSQLVAVHCPQHADGTCGAVPSTGEPPHVVLR